MEKVIKIGRASRGQPDVDCQELCPPTLTLPREGGGKKREFHGRSAFITTEIVIALGIMAMIMVLVAQLGVWCLRERFRTEARHLALELATNVLEQARSTPWEKLTSAWADSQKLSEENEFFLPSGKLVVKIEPEKDLPQVRRVSVTITWQPDESGQTQQVQLIALFGPGSRGKGGRP